MSIENVLKNYVNKVESAKAAAKKDSFINRVANGLAKKQADKEAKAKEALKPLKAKLTKLKAMKSVQEYIKTQKAIDKLTGNKVFTPQRGPMHVGNGRPGRIPTKPRKPPAGALTQNREPKPFGNHSHGGKRPPAKPAKVPDWSMGGQIKRQNEKLAGRKPAGSKKK